MNNFLSSFNSRSSKKRREKNRKIEAFFENKKIEKESLQENYEIQKEIRLNNLITESNDFKSKRYEKKKNRIEQERFNKSKIEEIFIESLVYIIYNSMPLDESFKIKNKEYVIETAETFLNTLKDKGCLKIQEHTIADDIYRKISFIFNENKDNFNVLDEKKFGKNLKEACSFELINSIDIIKRKIVNTINDEKKYSKFLDKCKNEDFNDKELKKSPNSLFRNIFEGNISAVIKEESENSGTLTKEQIMKVALSESIMDYTLLETLHTLKLANTDISGISNISTYFKLKEDPSNEIDGEINQECNENSYECCGCNINCTSDDCQSRLDRVYDNFKIDCPSIIKGEISKLISTKKDIYNTDDIYNKSKIYSIDFSSENCIDKFDIKIGDNETGDSLFFNGDYKNICAFYKNNKFSYSTCE